MAFIGTYQYRIPYGPLISLEGLPFAAPSIPDQIVEVHDVIARVTSTDGGKNEVNAILTVFVEGLDLDVPAPPASGPGDEEHDLQAQPATTMRVVDSFSLRFVPDMRDGADNFVRQAYLLFAADPRCATLVSDE
ncbi:hypothetical protein [Hydrocarboniphaga effusa]|uniref:hypothetical protein n=1 Tax=Hydrocarboniphaga effusa TaxID=243629 RepID=UPI003BAC77B6